MDERHGFIKMLPGEQSSAGISSTGYSESHLVRVGPCPSGLQAIQIGDQAQITAAIVPEIR